MAGGRLGFFARLFGGGNASNDAGEGARNEDKAIDYNGFRIVPAPIRHANGWLTAGFITRAENEVVREHRFVRADTLASREAAEDHMIVKAKRTIDEQGEALFRDG